ncbi:DUF6081 family protein [Streptomyces klenkii]|uniref:DUF6081 family protein n=1 Tax=Streptomyces klenkii TaxID=1420899 RepID=UPI00343DECEA
MTATYKVKTAVAVAAAAIGIALLPTGAQAVDVPDSGAPKTLFFDDFRNGFAATGAGARWETQPTGGLANGDGITSTTSTGLKVVPTGTDPATGKPAFVSTSAPQSQGGNGTWDHVKWGARPKSTSKAGYPGFDTPKTGSLHCTTNMSATTTGTEKHPFGTAVADPQSDPRLAAGAMVVSDAQSAVIFDFFVTNKKVYAIYERLRMPGTTYAAYSYAVPVADRASSTQRDNLRIVVDSENSAVTWFVNDKNVLNVKGIGTRAVDRKYMTLDHGGTEEVVHPRQLNCGVSTFTLLDGAVGSNTKGLVRLDSTVDYFDPRIGAPTRQTFLDETSAAGNRLWGQGATLDVSKIEIITAGDR